MKLDAHALTVPGRRSNNEDAVCARPDLGLFVVADGMGGYEGGEVASAIAVDAICELVRRTAGDADVTWPFRVDPRRSVGENEIAVATRLAGERIAARRHGVLAQMGSTVAVLRVTDDHVVVGHVGDSRVYRLRAGRVTQLTRDHSLLAELAASGASPVDLDNFPYRHVVTRALGTPTGEPEVSAHPIVDGDVYLLCSDGLSEVLGDGELAAQLARPAEAACVALVDAAYAAGSRDNISAVVVRVRR
ncbi:MAG: serine/threonine-protein phosphatase [Kofleriaceae bacterium]|nr:serine/threonine-protein phosphatase [Kofleriaceae bacterium]MBP6839854.1 serine/threonine-protein phosphatase [Kofleriaceae bacterium]